MAIVSSTAPPSDRDRRCSAGKPAASAHHTRRLITRCRQCSTRSFRIGNDGRVYTSWWHEGSDWTGINNNWRAIGGFFPAGAPVGALARMSDQVDLFVVGNDGRVYTSWWHEGFDWSGLNNNWRPIGGFFPVGI